MKLSEQPELRSFKQEQLQQALFEAQTVSPLVWIYLNKGISERGIPIQFKDHRFLIQPWNDLSPKQVYMKSAQVGVSIMNIFKTLWMARFMDMNIIYTLPTFEDARIFVSSKVNPIIQNNRRIASWIKDKDAVETKRVGKSFIFYRGTFTSKEALMLTSDLNAYDEVDRSDKETVETYSSRLKYSNFQGEWFFSNPSAPTAGVGARFTTSCQYHWFIRPSCGHWQYMDWEKNVGVRQGGKFYMCEKCGKGITRDDRERGQWVAKYPKREVHGYWINQMMAPWVTCQQLIEEEENKDKAYFYNFVLGKPYIGSDIVIDASLILRNVSNRINSKTDCIMGVDQGLKKHFVVGNKEGIFEVGTTKDWKDIENIRNKYDAIAIMDALPDLTVPRQLREKYPHKVYLCYYHRDKDKAVEVKWGKDKDWGYVWADRNRTLQTVIDYLSDGRIKFQMNPYSLGEFISHWKNMYKMVVEDAIGVPKFVWEANGADHFCHSLNYFLIGLKRFSEQHGAVLKDKTRLFHGEPSFEVTNNTMPGKPIFAKEERDWRYV